MNILLVTETYLPYITGVSISTDSIARYMISRGHTVTLICPKPLARGETKPTKNLKIIYIPSLPFSFYNLNATAIFPLAFPIIKNVVRKNKFDVVHIQEPGAVGVATLIAAKKEKLPVVGALHFIPEQIDRVLGGNLEKIITPIINIYIKTIYNHYDAIMTPSIFFAKYLQKLGIRIPINVISNGTNTKEFNVGPKNFALRKKLGFKRYDVVFLFLGRIDKDKNVETLIRALQQTSDNVKLLTIGKGTEKDYLKNLSVKLKVENKIVWVDYITNSEMPSYYHAVDIFAIMSPYEGQSIVTLQAVATGLPIIVANAGALPELCIDKINGFLVSTYDHKTLAEKMNILAGDKNLREKMGKESRKISLMHDKRIVLKKLEDLYLALRANVSSSSS